MGAVTTYKCKAPLAGTIRVTCPDPDGMVVATCDYTHTDWPEDHPERWVGDQKRVPWSWVAARVTLPP
jgi:hypothetical protein